MNWEEIKELAPDYAIGALDMDEARKVENFMRAANPEQRREFAQWTELAALLPLSLPASAPPDNLRVLLLDNISGRTSQTTNRPASGVLASGAPASGAEVIPFAPPQRRVEPKFQRWLLMAASVLLALTSVYLFYQNSKIAGERDKLAADLDKANRDMNTVVAPSTKVLQMIGAAAPQSNAKVIWDTKTQVWKIYIFDLPKPPSDKDYQLWYVTKDAKISAVVFQTDAQGRKVLTLTLPAAALQGLAATGITLEPKGGSSQPTSDLYLKAAI